MVSLRRGALIVLEGVDRTGKTTQCRQLVETLNEKGVKAEFLNFPDRSTPTGQLINQYLQNKDFKLNDKAIHLLFSANRWENFDKMHDLLTNGVTLIVDRYSYSGIAFSTIKRNMDYDWCKQPENGLIKPDLVFLLTSPQDQLNNRPGFGMERYENQTIQQNVAQAFLKLSKEDNNWEIIDASCTKEQVHEILLSKVLEKINQVQSKQLEYLNFNKTQSYTMI